MESHSDHSLLETLEHYRTRRFTGRLTVVNELDTVSIWFVRGNLAHMTNLNGDGGWKALENVKGGVVNCVELADDLPPQRSIRVETGRLLKAMRSSATPKSQPAMRVPVPFHVRLQNKFNELRNRFAGLRAYELSKSDDASLRGAPGAGSGDRTILERDPRGCKWTHVSPVRSLTIRGDESTVTSDIISAGEELWSELEKLSQIAEHE